MPVFLVIGIPLTAFLVLAAAFAVILRRTSRVLIETRDTEQFRRAVDDLASRIDQSLGGAIERIDAVRRHLLDTAGIADNLAAATDAVARYTDEASALHGPVPADEVRAALLAELDRAGRALEMVEHGARLLDAVTGPQAELEAQTAIKRGYLNLLHAREAIVRHADDLATGRPQAQRLWLSRRPPRRS